VDGRVGLAATARGLGAEWVSGPAALGSGSRALRPPSPRRRTGSVWALHEWAATTRPTATWATPPSSRLRSAGHGAPTGMRPRRSARAREARAAYRRAIKLEGIEGAAVDVQSERANPVHSSAR